MDLYRHHANDLPELPSLSSVEEGSPDFITLATAHKLEHYQFQNEERLEFLEKALLAIATKVGAKMPKKEPKKAKYEKAWVQLEKRDGQTTTKILNVPEHDQNPSSEATEMQPAENDKKILI